LGELDAREREQTVLFYKRGTRVELVDMEADVFVQQLLDRLDRSGGYLGAQKQIRRAQVFISYERSDDDVAKRLYDSLPKDRFDTWLDTSFLQGGEDWNSELEDKIRSSDYFLILNSTNLAKKTFGYVNKEVSLALELQKYRQQGTKFIIPILVEEMTTEEGRRDLQPFQQLPLRSSSHAEDVAALAKTMFRDFQLRTR
jgi:TIR domain